MNNNARFLVIVGLPCSGKTTVAKMLYAILTSFGYSVFRGRVSDAVRKYCQDNALSVDARAIRETKESLSRLNGRDYWAMQFISFFSQGFDFLIIEGVWELSELEHFRKLKDCKVIGLETAPEELARRLLKRNETPAEFERVSEIHKNFPISTYLRFSDVLWQTACPKVETQEKIHYFIAQLKEEL